MPNGFADARTPAPGPTGKRRLTKRARSRVLAGRGGGGVNSGVCPRKTCLLSSRASDGRATGACWRIQPCAVIAWSGGAYAVRLLEPHLESVVVPNRRDLFLLVYDVVGLIVTPCMCEAAKESGDLLAGTL